jgi:hypothetical protein
MCHGCHAGQGLKCHSDLADPSSVVVRRVFPFPASRAQFGDLLAMASLARTAAKRRNIAFQARQKFAK